MKKLFKNIKELIQTRETSIPYVSGSEMNILPTLKNAFLVVEDGLISDFGSMENVPNDLAGEVVDCEGKMILPSWCDSHTHLVYAGNREGEFVDRINGLSYEEIANKGGGILNSASKLQQTSEEDLYNQSCKRLEEIIKLGTGAIEIKSGYGLSKEAEIKMLRVIKKLRDNYPVPVKATFLGAHALPKTHKNASTYIDYLINDVLPEISKNGLADYIDIFCEKGYFDIVDTEKLLKAGKQYGLIPKIHVNQFNAIGGVEVGVNNNALSVDHLEVLTEEDVMWLKGSGTMPVALPGCSFFLSIPYTPARKLIDSGLPLALATDFNPGSAPSGNMNFVISAACIKMNMTPEEAINAATINGAYAMGLENDVGSITKGKKANLIVTKPISSYDYIPYSFGSNLIDKVFLNGIEQ
ncbi:imidazolonepropionase [Spongiivirga sp. MCCC 1A20706]|uniref:imidazolonepropionase n=1 Tax=Spongiivirga sp. MCCC 1A20706 TaxID=3160963 RepID=UPI003977C997